jgi:hypothetical protein
VVTDHLAAFSDQTTLMDMVTMAQIEGGSESGDRLELRTSTLRIPSSRPTNNLVTTQDFSASSYSESSSIARFPSFQFSLGALSTLASANGNVCLLLAVLEVDGPDQVTVRRGPDVGCVISVLRLIVGDETSTICKLTAWRKVAEAWGGTTQAEAVRRGDVVYFESAFTLTHPPTARLIFSCCTCAQTLIIHAFDRRPGHRYGRQWRRTRARPHRVSEPTLPRRDLLPYDTAYIRPGRRAPAT